MKTLIILSVLFSLGCAIAASEKEIYKNKYTVLASRVIRSKQPYRVFIHGLDVLFEFEIKLLLASDDGSYHVEKIIRLNASIMNKTVEFDTSSFPLNANYFSLIISSALYNETRLIGLIAKENSLLLQINKMFFKPDDVIKFRVFSVDSETNAVNPIGPVLIKLFDTRLNQIANFSNVTFTNGKYEDQWQLSGKPLLGKWKLTVQYKDENPIEKYITVDNFISPQFNVSLSVSQEVAFTSSQLPITVNAEYSFKQPVNGTATISIKKPRGGLFIKNYTCNAKSTTFFINFVDLGCTDVNEVYLLRTSLVFTDSRTNMTDIDEATTRIVSYSYKLEIINDFVYKPGTDFTYTIVSKTLDDKPAPNMQILVQYGDYDIGLNETTLTTGKNGTISSSFKTFVNTTKPLNLNIEGYCVNARQCTGFYSYSNPLGIKPQMDKGINLELVNLRPSFSDEVNVLATFAEKVDQFFIFLSAKGVLLESRKIIVNGDVIQFSFKSDYRYTPFTNIYAFYYKKNEATFVDTTLTINFKQEIPNYVKLNLKDADATGNVVVKPGSNITLTVDSKPSSIVSLVAIDQRVLKMDALQNIRLYDAIDISYKYESLSMQCSFCQNSSYPSGKIANMYFYTNVNKTDLFMDQSKLSTDQIMPSIIQASAAVSSNPTTNPIRTDFSETWLWEDVAVGSSPTVISRKVPDAMTTYFIYGIAMSKTNGIGLTSALPTATIFLPFFISLELPPTIKRNESLPLEIKVFNYLGSNQTATLTVTKDSMYDAINFAIEGWTNTSTAYTKQIKIANNDYFAAILTIKPKLIGVLSMKVSVKSSIAGDEIQKPLRVIYEGIQRIITSSTLIYVNSTVTQADKLLQCKFPASAFSESSEISVIIAGAILGKAMNNLDRLILLPAGCPEQIVVRFVPNYVILVYLEAIGKLTAELRTKLLQNLSSGYANMLVNQNSDGSFKGSTWLSAYIALYFQLTRQYITIDSKVIENALNFIISKQNIDGSFNETGSYYSYQLQSGTSKGIALCGYLVVVLAELAKSYSTAIAPRDLAVHYLEQKLNSINDTFTLAIVAYALQIANSKNSTTAYNLLFARKIEPKEGTEMHWELSLLLNTTYNGPRSLNIETTAYALKAHMARNGDPTTSLKIVRYLISQDNPNGGYTSSQDTIVTLTALSTFASSNNLNQEKMSLKLTPNVGSIFTAQITTANMFTLQTFNLNSTSRQLTVHLDNCSSGIAVVSLICKYYEDPSKAVSSYEITYDFKKACLSRIQVRICARLLTEETYNMAIMEVRLPTGFSYDDVDLSLNQNIGLNSFEMFEDFTNVVLYLDKISTKGTCVILNAWGMYTVMNLKPGSIIVNDYYDTSIQGSASFVTPSNVFSNTTCT